MEIAAVDERPLHLCSYVDSSPRGPSECHVPVLRVLVSGLPESLDAIVALSDLQGRVSFDRPDELAGIGVAEELELLSDDGVLPPLGRIGILLAGDLYALPPGNRLGGFGDVREVWRAFADRFAWVVGVAGNHDSFGTARESRDFASGSNWDVLDLAGAPVEIERDGIRIAGLGGIVGSPAKPHRRSEEEYATAAKAALAESPQLWITHQHPQGAGAKRSGSPGLEQALRSFRGLSFFGHKHSPEPLHRFHPEGASLATDGRILVLTES